MTTDISAPTERCALQGAFARIAAVDDVLADWSAERHPATGDRHDSPQFLRTRS